MPFVGYVGAWPLSWNFIALCDGDPAYDLVALLEKITANNDTRSPLAVLVQEEKYTQLLEDGFFARIDQILGASEKDLDACFSLCFALLNKVDDSRVSDIILRLATALSQDHTTYAPLKLRLLSILFNLLDTTSSLRVTVFLQMLRLALESNQSEIVVGQFNKIEQWLKDWNLSDEKLGELYLLMSKCYKSSPRAKILLIKYLNTFQSADSKRLDTSLEHSSAVVKDAIADPNLLQCDGLLDLLAVQHLNRQDASADQKQLYRLLSIFSTGTAADFAEFVSENKDAFETLGLNVQDGQDKIRRLSLISACGRKSELTYEEVKEACGLPDLDDVEEVVIDAVGAGSLDAKLDQENSVLQIRRVDQRSFSGDAEAWGVLAAQLDRWSLNIQGILNHMSENRLGGDDVEDQ